MSPLRYCPRCSQLFCNCAAEVARARNAEPVRKAHRSPAHAAIRRALLVPGAKCEECGTGRDLTVDYVVPLAGGGRITLSNARVLCRRHNSARGGRLAGGGRPLT